MQSCISPPFSLRKSPRPTRPSNSSIRDLRTALYETSFSLCWIFCPLRSAGFAIRQHKPVDFKSLPFFPKRNGKGKIGKIKEAACRHSRRHTPACYHLKIYSYIYYTPVCHFNYNIQSYLLISFFAGINILITNLYLFDSIYFPSFE